MSLTRKGISVKNRRSWLLRQNSNSVTCDKAAI